MDNKKKIIIGGLGVLGIILIIVAVIMLKSPKTYIVSFDTVGGNLIAMQEVKDGEKVMKPTDPTKENFVFSNWQYQNSDYDFNTPVKSDMTLVATWKEKEKEKFEVTLKLGDKTEIISVSELNEVNLDELTFDKKDGYDVVWYLNGEKYNFTTPLTGALTLEGKYEKITSYTVKFSSNSDVKVSNQTVKGGETVKEPSSITKYGYIFDGWYLNNTKYDFSTPVTKNITLVAKWMEDSSVPRYTVTFDSNGGSKVNSAKVMENNTVGKPSNPTKEGYTFKEWQLNGKTYNFSTKVTKDITLVAVFTQNAPKYTITFNSNGGSSVASQTVEAGRTVNRPSNPTRNGYIFKRWLLNGNEYNFGSAVNSNITLVADWEEIVVVRYTVTFNSNGGSSVASQTVEAGRTVNRPSNPTRNGYIFKRWLLNGNEYNFSSAVNNNITLVADWDEKTYKITAQSVSNTTNMDVVLSVWDGNNKVNAKDILLTNGTSMGFTWNTAFYNSTNEFIVVLQDGSRVKAKK